MLWSDAFIPKYSKLVYNAFWFSPERKALQALATGFRSFIAIANITDGITTVRVRMNLFI